MVKYIKCPRCDLNYIDSEKQEYCDVCIAELKGKLGEFLFDFLLKLRVHGQIFLVLFKVILPLLVVFQIDVFFFRIFLLRLARLEIFALFFKKKNKKTVYKKDKY